MCIVPSPTHCLTDGVTPSPPPPTNSTMKKTDNIKKLYVTITFSCLSGNNLNLTTEEQGFERPPFYFQNSHDSARSHLQFPHAYIEQKKGSIEVGVSIVRFLVKNAQKNAHSRNR